MTMKVGGRGGWRRRLEMRRSEKWLVNMVDGHLYLVPSHPGEPHKLRPPKWSPQTEILRQSPIDLSSLNQAPRFNQQAHIGLRKFLGRRYAPNLSFSVYNLFHIYLPYIISPEYLLQGFILFPSASLKLTASYPMLSHPSQPPLPILSTTHLREMQQVRLLLAHTVPFSECSEKHIPLAGQIRKMSPFHWIGTDSQRGSCRVEWITS